MRSELESLKRLASISVSPITACARATRCTIVDLAALPQGPVHAILAMLPYTTWARGRHQSPRGPPFLRDCHHPWGLPWLSGRQRQQVEHNNDQLRDIFGVLQATRTRDSSIQMFFIFPEDLGRAALGRPACPWQLRELRAWSQQAGWKRQAFFQCEFGKEPHRFPCGVLSSETLNSRRGHRGWPTINEEDGKYLGPLPPLCRCGHAHEHHEAETKRKDPSTYLRPGFIRWLIKRILSAGLLRTGIVDAHTENDPESDSHSDSDGDTWEDTETEYSIDDHNGPDHLDSDLPLLSRLGLATSMHGQDAQDDYLKQDDYFKDDDFKDHYLNQAPQSIINHNSMTPHCRRQH